MGLGCEILQFLIESAAPLLAAVRLQHFQQSEIALRILVLFSLSPYPLLARAKLLRQVSPLGRGGAQKVSLGVEIRTGEVGPVSQLRLRLMDRSFQEIPGCGQVGAVPRCGAAERNAPYPIAAYATASRARAGTGKLSLVDKTGDCIQLEECLFQRHVGLGVLLQKLKNLRPVLNAGVQLRIGAGHMSA